MIDFEERARFQHRKQSLKYGSDYFRSRNNICTHQNRWKELFSSEKMFQHIRSQPAYQVLSVMKNYHRVGLYHLASS